MITRDEAEDMIEEIALASTIEQDDIDSLRARIPSRNPYITPLLEELASMYFLTEEVLDHYVDRLLLLVNEE